MDMYRVGTRLTDAHQRFLASDPGLIRMMSALGTLCAVLLTLGVVAALGASVPILVTGALTAMVSTAAVTEPRPRDQAVTLALGVPVAGAVMAVGSALAPYRVAADVVFVLLIFTALYIRLLGPRATTLGIVAFQLYFVSQFVETRVGQLPWLLPAVLLAFAGSALVRFTVLRSPPERTSARLERAFLLRLARVLDALIGVAEGGPEAPRAERAVDGLRRCTARLHTIASLIRNQVGTGTPDQRTASAIQRRVTEAETAVERLAILTLRMLWPGADVDTLTRHLATSHPAGAAIDARDAAMLPLLIAQLHVLRTAADSAPPRPTGPGPTEVRRLPSGPHTDRQPPDASPAMRDAFRCAGDLARALSGPHPAVDEHTPAADRGFPETPCTREEPSAEDPAPAKDAAPKRRGPRVRPTTRTALQVATGSALAVVGGELVSPQRWYWAVFTCWVVFISTASTGEILVRGYRRLIGTVAGVLVGLALAALTGDAPRTAFVLACLSVFGMYYTITVSYTLTSFFVTTMIGMLYALLHALTPGVLVTRIEETALGIACGLIAALLVFPIPTRDRTDRLLRDVLERLREALSQSLARLGGEPGGDPLGSAHALDSALDSLRLSMQPLILPTSPWRSRRRTALLVLGLLETAAFHTRGLATTAELAPTGLHVAAPRLVDDARRIDHNLTILIGRTTVRGEGDVSLPRGPGIATRFEASEAGTRAEDGNATRRALRHLRRVDESVQCLARTLHLPVRHLP